MQRKQYSEDEKIGMVKAFLESGLTKYRFVSLHPEYCRTTLLQSLNKYSKQLEGTGTATDTDNNSETSGKLDSVEKFNSVVDTAKMSKEEIGAYCRSNGIYSTELDLWKLNCMNANNKKVLQQEAELQRLRAENRELREYKSKAEKSLKNKETELSRMTDALAEYAVKEVFLKKAQSLFERNKEER